MKSISFSSHLFRWMMPVGLLALFCFTLPRAKCESLAPNESLPPAATRLAIFQELSSEMERLDGAALLVRENRPETWAKTVGALEFELSQATDTAEVARIFRRLDATYPSLHANVRFGKQWPVGTPSHAVATVGFDTDWDSWDEISFRINRVDAEFPQRSQWRPRVGDRIVAINGKDLADWRRENFIFCKFSLRTQCDYTFPSRFWSGILSWRPHEPLSYTLVRGGRRWKLKIPLRRQPVERIQVPSSSRLERFECGNEPDRYPGFELRYTGNRACVFESTTDSKTAVLRIVSFDYQAERLRDDQPIRKISEEVEKLTAWWMKFATWRHLVIDVTDNRGGSPAIGYYRLLLRKNFQEQYVQFKKTPELLNPELRNHPGGFFWASNGHELWWQGLQESSMWNIYRMGEFLTPVPQACADEAMDCSEGVFAPEENPFRGRISVLVNSFCISACDAFVWQLQSKGGAKTRFFGHPNAADPAYARLELRVDLDTTVPRGFRIEVGPRDEKADASHWLVQTIYVTKTVTITGGLLDGQPVTLTEFVPWHFERASHWLADTLSIALQ